MEILQVLGLILIGLIIGVIARLVLPGRQKIGLPLTLLLGVAGAVIGGLVASYLGTGEIFELNVLGFIIAVIAAVALLAAAQAAGIGAPKDRERLHDGGRAGR